MIKLNIILLTKDKGNNQVLGELLLYDRFRRIFDCKVLQRFPGIPVGNYKATIYKSPKLKREVLLLNDVPGHEYIEIHNGNYYYDSSLCFLVGKDFTDIDSDGLQDVTDSRNTLDRLLKLIPPEGVNVSVFGNPLL